MAALQTPTRGCSRLLHPSICRGAVLSRVALSSRLNEGSGLSREKTMTVILQDTKCVHNDSVKKPNDFLDTVRRQIKHVGELRDNVTRVVTSLGAINVEFPNPGRFLPDYQKYLPSISLRSKTRRSKDLENSDPAKQTETLPEKNPLVSQSSSLEMDPLSSRGANLFEKAMEDTHHSIESYYRSSGVDSPLESTVHNAKLREKFSAKQDEDSTIRSLLSKAYKIIEPGLDKRSEKIPLVRKDFVSKTAIKTRTKSLVQALKACSSDSSRLVRMEDLCKHLLENPESRAVATKESVVPTLLRLRRCSDVNIEATAREALALLGYIDPVKGRGIRILTVDGGGTKGLVALQTLKQLEQACKTDITQLFDFVCGVSTGALILAMVFMFHIPLNECEHLYKQLSLQMFTRNKLLGTGKLVWSHAFYDTEIWEKILKENLGDDIMIQLSRDPSCPKMASFSCLMNVPKLKNFIFRNYNLPPEVFSLHPGNCKHRVWEMVRASSAAPGYYEEFKLGDFIHQDGGILTNNPTAIGIHESKLLWPDESIQCVISLGNGRHEPSLELTAATKVSLKDKVSKIVDSATDTEAVHTILQDLMAPSTYYRFNPYLSEEFMLDEIRPEKQESMQHDTEMYLRKNDLKIQKAAEQLLLCRRPHQKAADWLKLRTDMM